MTKFNSSIRKVLAIGVFLCLLASSKAQNSFYQLDTLSQKLYNYNFVELDSLLTNNGSTESGIFEAYSCYWKALSGLQHEQNLQSAIGIINLYTPKFSTTSDNYISLELLKCRVLITQKNTWLPCFS